MQKSILLTGFQPFDGETINPSWELVKSFHEKNIQDYQIISKEIPTVFYESQKVLTQYIETYNPEIIICFGQAGGSKTIRLEKVAINLNDARIPDNKGNQPEDELIDIKGPTAYFTKLPVRKICNTLKEQNIPVSISLSAGAFVCNHLFYHLSQLINQKDMIGGFIHIPYIDEQIINKENMFSMRIDELKKALELILKTIIDKSH